jgi:hypothetical protein
MIQSMVKCAREPTPRGRLTSTTRKSSSWQVSDGSSTDSFVASQVFDESHESGEPIGNGCVMTNCGFF